MRRERRRSREQRRFGSRPRPRRRTRPGRRRGGRRRRQRRAAQAREGQIRQDRGQQRRPPPPAPPVPRLLDVPVVALPRRVDRLRRGVVLGAAALVEDGAPARRAQPEAGTHEAGHGGGGREGEGGGGEGAIVRAQRGVGRHDSRGARHVRRVGVRLAAGAGIVVDVDDNNDDVFQGRDVLRQRLFRRWGGL